jgi:hypothetical protein
MSLLQTFIMSHPVPVSHLDTLVTTFIQQRCYSYSYGNPSYKRFQKVAVTVTLLEIPL